MRNGCEKEVDLPHNVKVSIKETMNKTVTNTKQLNQQYNRLGDNEIDNGVIATADVADPDLQSSVEDITSTPETANKIAKESARETISKAAIIDVNDFSNAIANQVLRELAEDLAKEMYFRSEEFDDQSI